MNDLQTISYKTEHFLLFLMFLIKNVNKNKWSSNRKKPKNTQLQFQNPGSYKKDKCKMKWGISRDPFATEEWGSLDKNKAGYTAVRCVPRRDRHICTRPIPSPHPSFLPLPPLDIPSSSEVEFTRFRVFETKALRTDGPMDGRTDPLVEMRGRI